MGGTLTHGVARRQIGHARKMQSVPFRQAHLLQNTLVTNYIHLAGRLINPLSASAVRLVGC